MEKFKEIINEKESIRIGKNGVSDNLTKHIKDLIKSKRILKIKILKSALLNTEKEQVIAKFIKKSGLYLLDVRGNTFIVSKKRINGLKTNKACKKIVELSKSL
ncbi:MAG: hypothetical protein GF364_18525 [Candidatus Lokiarchaeota archaeon]|nr:hypothetical protein [Candidatus Lokiarchaeota archaeon]